MKCLHFARVLCVCQGRLGLRVRATVTRSFATIRTTVRAAPRGWTTLCTAAMCGGSRRRLCVDSGKRAMRPFQWLWPTRTRSTRRIRFTPCTLPIFGIRGTVHALCCHLTLPADARHEEHAQNVSFVAFLYILSVFGQLAPCQLVPG